MLKIYNLFYKYHKTEQNVIQNLSLEFKPGGVYGLLGANGVGKSTLLYLIAGLLTPKSGSVMLNNNNTAHRLPATLCDTFIVPEEFTFPPITLDEWIKVSAPFYPKFNREEMDKYLTDFRLSGNFNLGRLSMGEKKKVLISFALASNTSLLLMDEPTNGLDIPGKSDFRKAIMNAQTEQRTIIISTHQVRDLDQILQRITIMTKNGILLNSPLDEIASHADFELVSTAEIGPDVIFCQPIPGGFGIIRRRNDNSTPLTQVNLELLFECLYTNPEKVSEFI